MNEGKRGGKIMGKKGDEGNRKQQNKKTKNEFLNANCSGRGEGV